MLRLYPLAVRGLLAVSARGAGATGFVALSRAARSSLTGVLPAFALVLALSLATFAGMVSNGIARGEIAASWHTTGADVLIEPGPLFPPGQFRRGAGDRRGPRRAACHRGLEHELGHAVRPADHGGRGGPGQLRGRGRGHAVPRLPGGQDRHRGGRDTMPLGATVPVLASPSAAAILGTGATQLTTLTAMGPFKVRVAGTLSSTPAQPGGGAFVVMPLQTLPGPGRPAAPHHGAGHRLGDRPRPAFRRGSEGDPGQPPHLPHRRARLAGQLTAAARRRADHRAHHRHRRRVRPVHRDPRAGARIGGARADPGPADRHGPRTGHRARAWPKPCRPCSPRSWPAPCAPWCCPTLVGSSIDLSAFTGTSAPVQFQPDVLALGLPAVAIVVLALAALTARGQGAAPSRHHRHAPGKLEVRRGRKWAPASRTWAHGVGPAAP